MKAKPPPLGGRDSLAGPPRVVERDARGGMLCRDAHLSQTSL
jgi:hypothetical protein